MPSQQTEARRVVRARQVARQRRLVGITGASILGIALTTAVLLGGADMLGKRGPGTESTGSTSAEATSPAGNAQNATAAPVPSSPATITIAAVGDMIFDRQVKALIAESGGEAPLTEVARQLAAADITVGNLESPLSNRGTRNTAKDVTFRGDPAGAKGLVLAGFDFLSMANNHVLDYGTQALADTITTLDGCGIGHAGAGMNKTDAWTPAVRTVNGTSVAFLSFSQILPSGFVATADSAGLAKGRTNMDEVCAAIRTAHARYDYVIVSFHWGVEYADNCNAEQVADAHRAVDAGADMVLSHHPHVIQAVEYYRGALVAYSLGDFVFDHYSRKTGEAFVLEAELGPAGVANATATPVYLDRYGKPQYVTGDAAATILGRLKTISTPRGTAVEVEGHSARILP